MSSTGSNARPGSRARARPFSRPAATSTLLRRSAMLRRGYTAITTPRSQMIVVDDEGSRAVDLTKNLQKGTLTAGNKFVHLYGYVDESDEEVEDAAPGLIPAADAHALPHAVDESDEEEEEEAAPGPIPAADAPALHHAVDESEEEEEDAAPGPIPAFDAPAP